MLTDVVGDCLTRIRNAYAASKDETTIPHSNLKEKIVEILVKQGKLSGFRVENVAGSQVKKQIIAELRYKASGEPVIKKISRVSRPCQRVYRKTPEKMVVRSGLGFQILTTSKGLMTEAQAKEAKVGGEVIAEVY